MRQNHSYACFPLNVRTCETWLDVQFTQTNKRPKIVQYIIKPGSPNNPTNSSGDTDCLPKVSQEVIWVGITLGWRSGYSSVTLQMITRGQRNFSGINNRCRMQRLVLHLLVQTRNTVNVPTKNIMMNVQKHNKKINSHLSSKGGHAFCRVSVTWWCARLCGAIQK